MLHYRHQVVIKTLINKAVCLVIITKILLVAGLYNNNNNNKNVQ